MGTLNPDPDPLTQSVRRKATGRGSNCPIRYSGGRGQGYGPDSPNSRLEDKKPGLISIMSQPCVELDMREFLSEIGLRKTTKCNAERNLGLDQRLTI